MNLIAIKLESTCMCINYISRGIANKLNAIGVNIPVLVEGLQINLILWSQHT